MMKDRLIKEKLLGYYIRKFWYPQLEVDILSKQRISKTKKLITDVDVLGLYTDVTGNFRLVLGDCKTLKNQSPITRTLWMRGLMAYLNSEKGIIILSKGIEKEHQLTSSILGVQLLSDDDFTTYSKGTADYITDLRSAMSEIDIWDAFIEIGNRYPPLNKFVEFSHTLFWNEQNSTYQLRSAIYLLRTLKGELNPANTLHQSLVLNHFSLVAIALNNILIQIFNQYLVPSAKSDLDEDLKVIIYGGIENYEFLNDLRKTYAGGSDKTEDLKLPNWDKFIELVRLMLDNPLSFSNVALLLKELAFLLLSKDSTKYNYSKKIISKDKFTSTFSLRLIEYLCSATGLPKEFKEIFTTLIIDLEKE
ncbi:hypothetical protein SAMN05428988_0372 [Chitinophaga sp. YR573]|uniref:hypothetical protein n=1 Tax=Chitinophaga sp. YR573 TaxID=1881040 RepID=UPI0008B2A504|nr:hypothetical protein [Chitinophaga sp. YR573]SEV91163.1 hypothetical protein SAMN05428988_0372 [Chitinophaga sp. YR573]